MSWIDPSCCPPLKFPSRLTLASRDLSLDRNIFTIGQYQVYLDKILGTGSFGEVRLAWDSLNETQVACKSVSKDRVSTCVTSASADHPSTDSRLRRTILRLIPFQIRNDHDKARLADEIELGMALDHPNLNTVISYTEIDRDVHMFLNL